MSEIEGSTESVKRSLELWLSRNSTGMVRIEYVSQHARTAIVNWLREKVAVEELILEPGMHPDRAVDLMVETLRKAAR